MPLRWTIRKASQEFGLHREVLGKRLVAAGIVPGADGHYSTPDICAAIYGDYESEKTRLTKEQADTWELKKKKLLRELVPAELVERVWSGVMLDLQKKISYLDLPEEKKKEILDDLQAIPIDDYFTDKKDVEDDPGADA